MRKMLVVGFVFLFLFTGLVAHSQAQVAPGTFAPFTEGPAIVAGNPEAAAFPLSVGFPRWLRDSRGIQLGLCLDVAPGAAGLLEAPPCPSLEADPVTGDVIAAAYYVSSVVMCNDPLECDQTPGAVPPNGEVYILEFAALAEPDPLGLEPPEAPGMLVRLRPGTAALSTPFNVETPFGNFPDLDIAPGRDEVRSFPTVDPALMKFRGNGTAGLADVFAPEAVPPAPPIAPIPVGPFPGFLSNGITTAPLNGSGGSTFRVIGAPGSNIDVATDKVGVEGKLFTTPTAEAGGLLGDRATIAVKGKNATGVMFARSNAAAGMNITQVAGAAGTTQMTQDPADTTRFFAAFPIANLPDMEVGISATALDATPAAIPELEDIAFVMNDTVKITNATFNAARGGTLTVRAQSSMGNGTRRAPGPTLTVESVPDMTPAAVGTALGTMTRGRFTLREAGATAPAFVRVKSSMGGSMTVPVSVRGAQAATDIVTIQSAVWNSRNQSLVIRAKSNVRGSTFTFQSAATADPTVPGAALEGTARGGRMTLRDVVVPPPFVRVESSGGGFQTVPVDVNVPRR